MKDLQLREPLEKLYSELIQITPATKELEKKRDVLAKHIQKALEKENLSEHEVSLHDVIDGALVSFEDAHPQAAKLMNIVTNILSSIGI